jgi:hypothetical protein
MSPWVTLGLSASRPRKSHLTLEKSKMDTPHVAPHVVTQEEIDAVQSDPVFWPGDSPGVFSVSVDDAIAVLNQIHRADPTVMPVLIGHRVPCNRELGDHPTVQVGLIDGADKNDQRYEVGLLGILNGIFGVRPGHRGGYIGANYDEPENRLLGFVNMETR